MRFRLPILIFILLTINAISLSRLDADSLWYDEAWSVYAVDAPPRATYEPPRGLRAQLRTLAYDARDDVFATLRTVANDVHPPLYFLLLDVWTWLAGESVFTLRLPSLYLGLLGVAVTATLGRRLFGAPAGVYAALLLGTSLLWTYYAREARMYTLLVTLAAAGTLAYVRFLDRPGWRRGVVYAGITALGLYTHYTATLVPLAHGIHLVIVGRTHRSASLQVGWAGFLLRWVGVMGLAAALYAPWLPTLYAQIVTNPNGPLATPEPTRWATVSTLIGYFAARGGMVYGVLMVLAGVGAWWEKHPQTPQERGQDTALTAMNHPTPVHGEGDENEGLGTSLRVGSGVILAGLWLIVVPGAVLAANALLLPIYNPRYTLAALPALFLLAGAGLAMLSRWRLGQWLAVVIALGLAADGLSAYNGGWGAKPPYREVLAGVVEARTPLDPALAWVVGYDPFHYHGTRLGLLDGMTVNIAGRDPAPDEVRALVERFATIDDVWLFMPSNHPNTWVAAAALADQDRIVTYRDGVQNILVYRLSLPADVGRLELPLAPYFGTLDGEPLATYTGGIAEPLPAEVGALLCLVPPVTDAAPGVGVSVTLARGYNIVLDQWHGAPGDEACVDIPADATGDHFIYISATNAADGALHPVWDGPVWWGNWIVAYRLQMDGG